MRHYRVIIPTFNAEKHLDSLLPALRAQQLDPADVLIIDSSSKDRTIARFQEFGAQTVLIPQSEFNHGGTRRMAAELSTDYDTLIYLTQDAIPQFNAFERLLGALKPDKSIGMAYGRQLPKPDAGAIERHARLTNYPPSADVIRTLQDRTHLGVKTTFCSNSFSAYSRQHLQAVGGFPEESFFGEDQITAGKMLLAGYALAYCGTAEVIHSHGYSMMDDFRRYFDVGVFHRRNLWLIESFGRAEGEGMRFILSELRYLAKHEPLAMPSALVRTALKYAGYRLGHLEPRLSAATKKKLSMSPYYWNDT